MARARSVPEEQEPWTRQEQELRARWAEIVLGALCMCGDGKYRTERVTKTVDQLWLASRAYRHDVVEEAALGRMMAL